MTAVGPACFRYDSPVYFDEIDLLGVMHNARYPLHIERAQSALFEHLDYGWTDPTQRHEDLNYVVRGMNLEFTAPVVAPGVMRVEVVAVELGRTSATWGYRCTVPGADGDDIPVAHGTRALVKVDGSGLPTPWTEPFRALFNWLAAGGQGPRP